MFLGCGIALGPCVFSFNESVLWYQLVEKQRFLTPLSGQDPDAWCDLSKFDLPEEPSAEGSVDSSPGQPQPLQQEQQAPAPRQAAAATIMVPSVTEYRLDGHTISDLSRSSRGELIPISPSTDVGGSGLGTPPSVLKRQKKRRVALSPVTENSASLSFLDSCNSLTPKSTPVKTLPFSPSQVCGPYPNCSLGAGDSAPGPLRAGLESALCEALGPVLQTQERKNRPGPALMQLTC